MLGGIKWAESGEKTHNHQHIARRPTKVLLERKRPCARLELTVTEIAKAPWVIMLKVALNELDKHTFAT